MQVTLRFSRDTAADRAAVIDRLMGCVLLQKELPSVRFVIGGFYFDTERSPMLMLAERFVIGGFYFDTERSPMLLLADLEKEGFHFDDFDSIKFDH